MQSSAHPAGVRPSSRWLLPVGVLAVLLGGFLAHSVQTAGGIRILDVRFAGTNGKPMSALLYVPPNATAKTPAPGILAVHGYVNSRETQSGFAIEFARRGYVVLALDQTGHGYSAPPAFANGFGGPDGLRYLRSLDIVDKDNIGLEGHSMGGWTVLAAAAAIPDGYRAVVLEGSSTGAPFAPNGTTTFPRNLAVVFSQLDEFSEIMWGVAAARDIAQSAKLQQAFGAQHIEPGKIYGSLSEGTARILYTPGGTHPMDHHSPQAIGHSLEWFQRTLSGGTPRPPEDQIWYWKELGTLIAFVGFVFVLLGAFDRLLALPYFTPLAQTPRTAARTRDARWWISLILGAALPALTLFPFFQLAETLLPPSRAFPQSFTNQILVWASLNMLIVAALSFLPGAPKLQFNTQPWRSIVIAVATAAAGYGTLAVADFLFAIDFRFWIVALKLLDPERFVTALTYLVPFTIFFAVILRALHANLGTQTAGVTAQYWTNVAALAAGFTVLLLVQYGVLVATGRLPIFYMNDTLRTIIAIPFVPLLAIVAAIATFTFRRTNAYLPGAVLSGLFVTWYVVAGQATHVGS
jgi:pimeloyl-ACP methyl ester carboxylesterase